MNNSLKFFIIVVGIVVIILSSITGYRLFFSKQSTSPQLAPIDSSVDTVRQAITTVSDQSFESGLTTINTEDFMNSGQTFEDPMNPGNYILSGNVGYCLENGFCPSGFSADNFEIRFNGRDGVFFIRLLEQPVRTARLDAEVFLQDVLKLSAAQLCDLDYYMSVSELISPQFAGVHLKFSTCPGSQRL